MLEGQVAALSAGSIPPEEAVAILEALFDSDIYRPDQHSFMLYPDRELPGFLAKNRVPSDKVENIPLLVRMLEEHDDRIIVRDAEDSYRFNADFTNVSDLDAMLDDLATAYGDEVETARAPLQMLYEQVFNHKAFTGRSGTMFGFEGLGSIYWHMVAKLMLAIEENFFAAIGLGTESDVTRRLGQLYYRVREGIGFNKTPVEYGAFPTDPYSHTPKHGGAKQPGMTGQVKEEVLSRFGELGVLVSDGVVHFRPHLLRQREFITEPREFCFLDVQGNWQDITVPAGGLAFTWCQVPIIYSLNDDAASSLTILRDDGAEDRVTDLVLSAADSTEIFQRSGHIRKISVSLQTNLLFAE